MHNVLASSAALPDHSLESLVDLRSRTRVCDNEQRPAWIALQQQLATARQQHSHEIHMDTDQNSLRLRVKTALGLIEHRFAADSPLHDALQLLQDQLWPGRTSTLAKRGWFIITIDNRDSVFQADYLVTSGGRSFTIRRLYDFQNPLLLLDQLFKLPAQCATLRHCLQHPQGLVLLADVDRVTRVVTARAIAQLLAGPHRRILLAETTCHPLVPGTTQITLPLDASSEQQEAWRQACDMSHDIVIALEVDTEPATLIRQASQECMVVQGVCAKTSSQALTQLLASGARPEAIARALEYIVVQQPIAKACDNCKVSAPLDDTLNEWISQQRPIRPGAISEWLVERLSDNFVQAEGCSECHGTGMGESMLTVNCVAVSKELRDALYDSDVRYAIEYLDNADTSASQLVKLARQGIVTIQYALSQLDSLQD